MDDIDMIACIDGPGPGGPASPTLGHELYKAFRNLGAPVELLAIVGSIGDTLSDDECTALLKNYNAGAPTLTATN